MTWARTSRHARGYGKQWDRIRRLILAAEPLCRPCADAGRVTAATQVDHIKPKAKGGGDDFDNLRPICKPCHDAKTIEDRGGKPKAQIAADGWPV